MDSFRIEIAGVPAEIRSRFPESEVFFRDYITTREPAFSVEPTESDLIQMRMRMEQKDGAEEHPDFRRSDCLLENNAIHALLAERLIRHDVLPIHGSALCMDWEAFLFTAPSGTGKSTHARLWRENYGRRVWMINDDKPMISFRDGIRVYGTPWDGKHHLSRNASAPLGAVIWLTRSAENRIRRMDPAEAFPVLMNQAYESEDPAGMAKIMALERKLLEEVDFYRLECNTDPEAAIVAREGICGVKR